MDLSIVLVILIAIYLIYFFVEDYICDKAYEKKVEEQNRQYDYYFRLISEGKKK